MSLDHQDIGLRYQRYGKALIALDAARKTLSHNRIKAKRARDEVLRQWSNVVKEQHLYADYPAYIRDMEWVLNGDQFNVTSLRYAEQSVKHALDELWLAQQGVKP